MNINDIRPKALGAIPIIGHMYRGDECVPMVPLDAFEDFIGALCFGFRLKDGRVERRIFHVDSFRDGEAQSLGWYSDPDEVPGGPADIWRKQAHRWWRKQAH